MTILGFIRYTILPAIMVLSLIGDQAFASLVPDQKQTQGHEGDETEGLSESLLNDLSEAESLIDRAPRQAFHLALGIAERLDGKKPDFIMARLLAIQSMAYGRLGANQEALQLAEKARALSEQDGEQAPSRSKAMVLMACARASHNLGKLAKALDYFYRAGEIYRAMGDFAGLATMGIYRAIIFNEIGQSDRATVSYETALGYAEKAENDQLRARITNNLAYTYLSNEAPQKALDMLEELKPVVAGLESPLAQAYLDNNIGEALYHLGRYAEARIYLEKSLKQAEQLGVSSLISGLFLILGRVEEAEGRMNMAMAYSLRGVAKARESYEPARLRDLLALKARLHYEAGNYKVAYMDLQESYRYRDEIASREVKRLAEVLNAQFSLDLKEQEITLLQQDREISALRLSRAKAKRNEAVLGALVLLIVSVVLGVLLKSKAEATVQAEAKSADLLAVQEKLQKANQTKSNILAMTSHEVRTPLNGIIGMAQVLLRSDMTSRQHQQIETIFESAETLLALLNDILDLSKIEAGHMDIREEPFDPQNLIEGLFSLWQARAEDKGLILTCQWDRSLPAGLVGDEGRIRQVLSNLISNAIKFSEDGDIKVTAERHITDRGRELLLFTVTDKGIGIEEDNETCLFEPFVQVQSGTTRQYGGTGLGLSICRELVSLMGGEIGYESEPGIKTRFWFTIPLILSADRSLSRNGTLSADDSALSQKEGQGPDSDGTLRRPRILIADDSHMNRTVLKEMLRNHSYELHFADHGAAVVETMKSGTFDLILMDMHMPVMNGADAARAIRSMENGKANIPIIALTADTAFGGRRMLSDMGIDDYLEKPIDRIALLGIIEHYLDKSRSGLPGKNAS